MLEQVLEKCYKAFHEGIKDDGELVELDNHYVENKVECIKCGSENISCTDLEEWETDLNIDGLKLCKCKDCDCTWEE